MRLLSLHLERYGPFTGRTVTFRPDARLHLVVGPNEAGKSSALAAVTDLLFGIETRTRHAYLHEMSAMRLGAEIQARDGRRLVFRRRKGLRNTLVDPDDAPLPEDALAPFLGGLSRDIYCRSFGLDARSLRQGGEEMIQVGGEVGASLFAAGSGLRGYSALQRDLDAEALEIFAPRAKQSRSFYQALHRYEDARKAIRGTELRSGDWRALNDEIDAAGARLDAIGRGRERIAAERARLERLKRVGPLIAGIDALTERAEADATLIEASDAWIDRLGTALAAVRTAEAERSVLDAALITACAEVDAVTLDLGLLGRAEEILEGFGGIDRFDKDGADLPRIQAEADRFGGELDRLAVRVGLVDAAALARGQPSDAARARVEGLIREGRDLAAALERAESDLAAVRADHDGLAREADEGAPPVDPTPLRAELRLFAPIREAVAARDALDGTIRRAAAVVRGQAARLWPPVTDPAALAHAPLPSADLIARFRTLLAGKEREREAALDRRSAALRARAATQARLREREAGRPIATHADLAVLRAERDRRLAPLRSALLDGGARVPASEVAAYERAVQGADRAADDLAADAARVAEHAADLQRLDADAREVAAVEADLAEIEAQAVEGLAAWGAAWEPAGLTPASPSEMQAWRAEADTLIEAQGDLEARRIDGARMSERIEGCREPLDALCRRVGLVDLAGLDIGLMLNRLEERVAALAARWDATRETQARVRAAAAGIARHEAGLAAVREREGRWRRDWAGALVALGLGGEARPEEAESALAAWRAVPTALAERDNRLGRVAGLRRDMDGYRADVARLVAAVAPDLAEMPPSAAIRALHGRLQAALRNETRRTELARRRDEAERGLAAAQCGCEAARGALAGHLAERPIDPASDALPGVEALHGRLCARRGARDDLAARRAELARVADGQSEAALRADLDAVSADAIEAELVRLAHDVEDLDQRGRVAFADRDRGERRRAELEGGIGAELALAQRKAAEADLGAAARQWAVLRLAHLMLGTAIARHRAGQQDPLLARAGALFAALTGGGFAGLAQDYDEIDTPRLVGRRATGEPVPVEGLSEGTRDQLYLALRLAYLEDFASRAEPAPFIGDDLFLTFDDARTAHGLQALASVGETIQPILFTHHGHVRDLARARLGEAVDIVDL